MKALKQRFSQWYHRRKGRMGVLWEGRYRRRSFFTGNCSASRAVRVCGMSER
jgi:hypothetical protein